MTDIHASARDASFVHETAVVEPGAIISAGVRIWHHCHVRTRAIIGAGSQLGKNVFIDVAVHVGQRVKIQNNVSLYSGVTIEDDVFIGPNAVFTNDRVPRAFGEWTRLDTLVARGASVGANATILPGLHIGCYAMVGAGAVVTRSVLSHQLVAGNPASHRSWICNCGLTLSTSRERPEVMSCETCHPHDG